MRYVTNYQVLSHTFTHSLARQQNYIICAALSAFLEHVSYIEQFVLQFLIRFTGFEPALLPQETIFPYVALAKGQIDNSRGQKIFYDIAFLLSNKACLSVAQEKRKTSLIQCYGCFI